MPILAEDLLEDDSEAEEPHKALAEINEHSRHPYDLAVNEVIRLLAGIQVPIQTKDADRLLVPVLSTVSRSDIQRFLLASEYSLKKTVTRIMNTAAWRYETFPVNTKACRIELQTGQFFMQGHDLQGHPIFYFRCMCLGPWRKDQDAVIAATLHRFETKLQRLCNTNSNVKITLIVTTGRPYLPRKGARKKRSKSKKEESESVTAASTAMSGGESQFGLGTRTCDDTETNVSALEAYKEVASRAKQSNPRIQEDELWFNHTTKTMATKLIEIVTTHYPERLHRALVVVGGTHVRSVLGGTLGLSKVVKSTRTREKVRFLAKYKELRKYVDRTQLVTFVGGMQAEKITDAYY